MRTITVSLKDPQKDPPNTKSKTNSKNNSKKGGFNFAEERGVAPAQLYYQRVLHIRVVSQKVFQTRRIAHKRRIHNHFRVEQRLPCNLAHQKAPVAIRPLNHGRHREYIAVALT